MTGDAIIGATAAHREALKSLTGVPWRQGRKVPRNIYAVTGDDWEARPPIGAMDTPELAAEAAGSHNAAFTARREEGRVLFGACGPDGRLTGYAGHSLWQMCVYLPDGREGEVHDWLTAHGIEVYRMQNVAEIMRERG